MNYYCNLESSQYSSVIVELVYHMAMHDGADTSASAGANPATPTEIFLPAKVLRFP